MIGEVRPQRSGRWIAAVAAVLALGSLVVGISIGNDGSPGGSQQAAGSGLSGTARSETQQSDTQQSDTQQSGTQQSGTQPTDPSSVDPAGGQRTGSVLPAGLQLSAGHAQQQPPAPVQVVAGTPLSAERIAGIIHRLPPWKNDEKLAQPFRWPTQTTPAPKAGKTIDIPFPGPGQDKPDKPAVGQSGPLTVLRMQPQGAVAIAPFISITFNQPMVPVATVGQLARVKVPVAISPKLAGSWQWIGTSTLRFVADSKDFDRLPMATNYTVTVPAGTRSVNGGNLGKAATFKFATPPPAVKQFGPTGSSMKLDPVFVAVFDQKMEPGAVLRAITATAGTTSWPMRLATAKEVAADSAAAKATAAAPGGRVVAFRPVRNLPVDQPITVTFAAGTSSAEGPRTTAKAATFTGHTYAALELANSQCDWGGTCDPSSPLVLNFNNTLDASVFDPAAIKISPEIPGGATVTVADKNIVVQGATQPDTDYTVTVPAGLVDSFGQKLAAPAKQSFTISPATHRR